jgi:hypothetical protein
MEFLLIIVVSLYLTYTFTTIPTSGVSRQKSCKPHIWRLMDEVGWLPADEPVGSDRWRGAVIMCAVCHKAPLADDRPPTGEY